VEKGGVAGRGVMQMSQKLTLPVLGCVFVLRVCAAGTNFIDFHFPPTHMRKLPQGRGSWKSLRYDQENKLSALTAIAYN